MHLHVQVRDHIPLEQGLRPAEIWVAEIWAVVRDHIPLEQGLRQTEKKHNESFEKGQRPYSIRTRIKTCILHRQKLDVDVKGHIP